MNQIFLRKIARAPSTMKCGLPIVLLLILTSWAGIAAAKDTLTEELIQAARSGDLEIVKNLLDKGADVNRKLDNGSTALMTAALLGHTDVVELLKKRGAEMTLAIASILDDQSEVQRLLENGADVNLSDSDGATPLMHAARTGDLEITELLLKRGGEVEARDQNGWTALMHASWAGNANTVKLFLAKGADINSRDKYGKTALMWVVELGHANVAKLLLEKGADVNAKQPDGWTVLRTAAIGNDIGMSRLLVEHGAEESLCVAAMLGDRKQTEHLVSVGVDINSRDGDGRTPLMDAARNGHFEISKLLIDKGADVNLKDSQGWTALMEAVTRGDIALAKLLLDSGSDCNAVHKIGWTALILAIDSKQLDMVKLLLQNGADTNTGRNKYGFTALMMAICSRQKAVSAMLLDKGADVNAKGEDNGTALIYGVTTGQADLVQKLLDKGADPNAEYWNRWRPLNFLPENHDEIERLLQSYGAVRATGRLLNMGGGTRHETAHGMAFRPKISLKSIAVDWQQVMIRLGKADYTVDCVLHLSNSGKTISEWIGFPKRWKKSGDFIRLDVWVDGRKIEVSEDFEITNSEGSALDNHKWKGPWLGFDVTVPSNGKTIVRVRYEADYSYCGPGFIRPYPLWLAKYEFAGSYWYKSTGKVQFTVNGTEIGGREGFGLKEYNRDLVLLPAIGSKSILQYSIRELGPIETCLRIELNKAPSLKDNSLLGRNSAGKGTGE